MDDVIENILLRLQLLVQRLVLKALNLPYCDNCGVVAARQGAPILLNHEDVCERGAGERFGYYCERCFNCGLVAEDLKAVQKEFGRLV